ncbi:MAG TPA: hypothetical protein VF912_15125 [Anaeromyxobacter sp.]
MGSAPEPEPVLTEEEERARVLRLRRFWGYVQAGGIVFLAVVALGLLPTIISASYPALGAKVAVAVWVLAPAVPIALLVVAAFRIRR